jgi:hypothetical protein
LETSRVATETAPSGDSLTIAIMVDPFGMPRDDFDSL